MLRRHPLGLLMVALLWALSPTEVGARPLLLRADPPDGALMAVAPTHVRLWFDHRVLVEPGALALEDAQGRLLAHPGADVTAYRPERANLGERFDAAYLYLCAVGLRSYPSLLTAHLPPLGAGTYRLRWRVLGLDDRRPAAGALVFVVDPARGDPAASATAGGFSGPAADLLLRVAVRPNLPGANFLTVHVADTRRPALAPVHAVHVRLTPPGAAPLPPFELPPGPAGGFELAGVRLDRPGLWRAEVLIRRPGLPDALLRAGWEVGAPPGAPWSTGGPLLIGLFLLTLIAAGWQLRPRAVARSSGRSSDALAQDSAP